MSEKHNSKPALRAGMLLLIVATVCWCWLGTASTASANSQDAANARPRSYPLAFWLPRPISETELDRYFAILKVGEPQTAFLRHLFVQYLEDWEKLHSTLRPSLEQTANTAGREFSSGQYSPSAAVVFASFKRDEAQTRLRLCAVEDSFLGKVKAILDETQLPLFERVRMARHRARCGFLDRHIPGAALDLSVFILNYSLADGDWQTIDPVLLAYEQRITPLFLELENTVEERSIRIQELESLRQLNPDGSRRDPNAVETREVNERVFGQIKAMLERGARLEREIVGNNMAASNEVCSLVDGSLQTRVRADLKESFFPELYPDRHDLTGFLQKAAADPSEPTTVRDFVREQIPQYQSGYQAVCKAMEERYSAWYDQKAQTQLGTGYEEFRTELRILRGQRSHLSLNVLRDLLTLPTSPDYSTAYKLALGLKAGIDRDLMDFDSDPFPRP